MGISSTFCVRHIRHIRFVNHRDITILLAIPAEIWYHGYMIDTNLTWAEEEVNLWKGWTYSPEMNKYFFDDVGNESLALFWSDEFLNQAYL